MWIVEVVQELLDVFSEAKTYILLLNITLQKLKRNDWS